MATHSIPRRSGHAARVVAIDIGSACVRAVEVERRGLEARLLKRGMAPISPGCWDDLAAARESLAQAIRSALAAGGIMASEVVTALPRRLVTLKCARLPHAAPEQIRGMVQFEAQQYIPFSLEEVVLDHQIVSDETEEMTTVMIVAARRALVENLLAVFDRAGLEVTRLSVSALALAEHAQNGGLPIGLLDVEPGEMDLAVVSAGRLLFARAAALPGAADREALAGEVARSLVAYQNEYRAQPVNRLLIAGSVDDLADVEGVLGSLLEVPVGRMNGRLLPAADPDALGYATALGLALGANGQGISRINLIPASRAERKVAARRRAHALVAAALLVLAAVVGVVWLRQSLAAQREERVQAVRENRRLEVAQAAHERVRTEHDRLAKTHKTVLTGLARDTAAVDVLKALSDAIPKDKNLHLTQFAFERGGSIVIHGSARTETAATDLLLALQASGAFTEVRLGYLGDAKAEATGSDSTTSAALPAVPSSAKTSFTITCKLKSTAASHRDNTEPGSRESRVGSREEAAPAPGTERRAPSTERRAPGGEMESLS